MQYTKLILTNCQRDVYQTTGSSSLQLVSPKSESIEKSTYGW